MNKTKTLTQGAMLLAIFGALVLIDRVTAYWFTTFVVLIAPVIIIMYSAMQTLKDGIFLSIGVIIIGFLLGNFNTTYLIYVPVGIITGIAYAIGVEKNLSKNSLLIIAVLTYLVGEVVAYYVIYPLLGFPVLEMIESFKTSLNDAGGLAGFNYSEIFAAAGLNLDKLVPIMYLVSTMATGAMEGVLIHFLSVFLLKRFKIKNLGSINLWENKPNKILSYVCMLSTSLLLLRDVINNENIYYVLIVIGMLGTFVLLYYGYLFVMFYGRIVLHRNLGILLIALILFMPALLIVLICLGFLYGSGPLRTYLENKLNTINNK